MRIKSPLWNDELSHGKSPNTIIIIIIIIIIILYFEIHFNPYLKTYIQTFNHQYYLPFNQQKFKQLQIFHSIHSRENKYE